LFRLIFIDLQNVGVISAASCIKWIMSSNISEAQNMYIHITIKEKLNYLKMDTNSYLYNNNKYT